MEVENTPPPPVLHQPGMDRVNEDLIVRRLRLNIRWLVLNNKLIHDKICDFTFLPFLQQFRDLRGCSFCKIRVKLHTGCTPSGFNSLAARRTFPFCFQYVNLAIIGRGLFFDQGGSKNGQCTFGIFWEDCYTPKISRVVCNKVRLF